MAALERQDWSCTHLAHHDLESVLFIIIISIFSIILIIIIIVIIVNIVDLIIMPAGLKALQYSLHGSMTS